jgi:NADPH2:quinone reductase
MCFDGVGGEVMMQSLRCLARGGRHLVVGFASGIEAEEVPMVSGRALCFGNFDILGVILAYLDRAVLPDADRFMPVPVPRFNAPPAELGERVQADLLELLAAGKIRPIVGRTMPFEQLPQALEDMESRATIGRLVVER